MDKLIGKFNIEVKKPDASLEDCANYNLEYELKYFEDKLSIYFSAGYKSTYENIIEYYYLSNKKLPEMKNFIATFAEFDLPTIYISHKKDPSIPIIYFTKKCTKGNRSFSISMPINDFVAELKEDLNHFVYKLHCDKAYLEEGLISFILEKVVPESLTKDSLSAAISSGMVMLLNFFIQQVGTELWSKHLGVLEKHNQYIEFATEHITTAFLAKYNGGRD